MVTDRVGDFIIRLKNASRIGKPKVTMLYSQHILAVAKKLKDLGFITKVSVEALGSSDIKKEIIVSLAYDEKGSPRLCDVKRISKPGRRLYVSHTNAHKVRGGTGVSIISSPVGVISDKEARQKHIGGENLFEIW